MSNPCTTCQPMPSCTEGLDRYSLQEDVYWYEFICPTGLDCGSFVGTVSMICCEGTEYAVTLPEGLLAENRTAILTAMANQCARRLAFCIDSSTGLPAVPLPQKPPVVPLVIYFSDTQTARVDCRTGDLQVTPNEFSFAYTVPPGRFFGFNYQAMNSRAMTEAQGLARARRFCLSDLPEEACADTAFEEVLRVSGPGALDFNSWSVTSGTLPPGLTLGTGWQGGKQTTLAGTPTTGGEYTFTLQATNSNNLSMSRSYTICIVAITPGTLPDGTEDVAYSQALAVSACALGLPTWSATGLPAGLSIDAETGVISGTPTVDGDFVVTVTVEMDVI